MKLTEDQVVEAVVAYLLKSGWTIHGYKLGMDRGADIEASKGVTTMLVEAKGARANDNAPHKKRETFNGGQIKSHFGRALVKILEFKRDQPEAKLVIAHPDDSDIRRHIGELIPLLRPLGISHYWVDEKGNVSEI